MAQDLVVQLLNETALLRQRDKVERVLEHSLFGDPACHHLQPGQPAVLEPDHRLEIGDDASFTQRSCQHLFRRGPGLDRALFRIADDATAAVAFGLVHGQVGLMEQLADVRGLFRYAGHPQTDRDAQLVAHQSKRVGEAADDAVENRADILLGLAVVQIDDEFIPAQPGYHVVLPNAGLQAAAHLLEQLVAGAVAQGVVDLLEVVHIDEDQRKPGRLVAVKVSHGMVEVIHQQGPVGQLGQRIVQGVKLQPAFQLLMLLELLLQPEVGLTQLLQALVDGIFRVDVVQLLADPPQLQQQGELAAQEVEKQPVIGFQWMLQADEKVGEVLLLQAQRLAVPIELLLVLFHVVGAVAQPGDEFVAVGGLLRIDLLEPVAVDAHQQHVLNGQHLAQDCLELGEQRLTGQSVGQPDDTVDALYLLLPVRVFADQRRGQLR